MFFLAEWLGTANANEEADCVGSTLVGLVGGCILQTINALVEEGISGENFASHGEGSVHGILVHSEAL